MTSVKEWLKKRKYFGATSGYTHLFLDGGKARVPPEHQGTFLNVYANSVMKNERTCLSECRTEVFKLFVDLDGHAKEPPSQHTLEKVLTTFQSCAKAAFVCEDPCMVACTTDPKRTDKGIKYGMHLIFKNVFVDALAAAAFREYTLSKLKDVEAFDDDWTTVFDAAVYKGSGLRMVFATKGPSDTRTYVPAFEVNNSGCATADGSKDIRKWVHATSIRNIEQPATPCLIDIETPQRSPAKDAVHVSLAEYKPAVDSLADVLPVQYVGQQFTGLVKLNESAYCLRSSSRYCHNIGKAHNSNNVYFELTPQGLCQRCYCRCDTVQGRRDGLCSTFRGPVWKVPPEVLKAFFPPSPDYAPPTQEHSLKSILARSRAAYSRKKTTGPKGRSMKRTFDMM